VFQEFCQSLLQVIHNFHTQNKKQNLHIIAQEKNLSIFAIHNSKNYMREMQKGVRIKSTQSISQKWIKAAAIGSIWAAIEIIAGSFLHNLRIPFSGTILSMVAVFMLVAFSMHWKERGIILRAGLIAALMKSISPSAVILGPMFAILMEAVLLELIMLFLGRNLFGYIVGGMLAVTWALVQKIITLLVLYGFDLVKIAHAFYSFLVNKTGLDNLSPLVLVAIVVGMYFLAGALAAIAGYQSFRRHKKKDLSIESDKISYPSKRLFDGPQPEQAYAYINIFLILFFLVLILTLLNKNIYIPAFIAGFSLIAFVLSRYKQSIRHLKKIRVWIQLLSITFLSALVWEWISTGVLFSKEGLIIGLEINIRALLIIFSFSAISVELRNPIVRSILYRNGFSNLYVSLNLAFSILPTVIEQIPQNKKLFRSGRTLPGLVVQLAEELIELLNRQTRLHENIYIVSGKVQGGKSTFLEEFVRLAGKTSLKIHGFIAEGSFKNKERSGFRLKDINSGESIQMASGDKKEGWQKFSRFYFNPAAFEFGRTVIDKAILGKADLIILDEVGPMELAGKGWSEVIEMLEKQTHIQQLWSVRERLLKEVRIRWHLDEENIYLIQEKEPADLLQLFIEMTQKEDGKSKH
jgi:nucleoside-triphosphatase THEP1